LSRDPLPRFLLYSREGCHLCERMADELARMLEGTAHRFELVDVDADPAIRARWGHKIPVLLLDSELVCHGSLDAGEVHKALAQLR
jgi:Glutaredoxin-like domain (DUF836)